VAAHGGAFTAVDAKAAMMAEAEKMDIEAIMRQLPHRYPFLMVDRVLECVPGERVLALKNVTFNEPFSRTFPHRPVMPGVMIIEGAGPRRGRPGIQDCEGGPGRQYAVLFLAIDSADSQARERAIARAQVTFKRPSRNLEVSRVGRSRRLEVASAKSWWLRRPRARTRRETRDDRFARGGIAAAQLAADVDGRSVHGHRPDVVIGSGTGSARTL